MPAFISTNGWKLHALTLVALRSKIAIAKLMVELFIAANYTAA